MEKHNFKPKLIIIMSENRYIYDALVENTNSNLELIDHLKPNEPIGFGKADILIIDKKLPPYEQFIFRANILINCSESQISPNEIRFTKPFKLADLIDIIERNQDDTNLFCCINKDWIYNQRLGTISSVDKCINLTDRENDIFKKLLSLKDYKAEKEYLLREVWHYHQSTESNTVETHLYKLKQKLPSGLLEIKNSTCFLLIDDLK